jgi:hypothetical protein
MKNDVRTELKSRNTTHNLIIVVKEMHTGNICVDVWTMTTLDGTKDEAKISSNWFTNNDDLNSFLKNFVIEKVIV